ncbi:hypothetical protein JXR93_09370 [bacterium]|nr:hypothetical protein [bacterium]
MRYLLLFFLLFSLNIYSKGKKECYKGEFIVEDNKIHFSAIKEKGKEIVNVELTKNQKITTLTPTEICGLLINTNHINNTTKKYEKNKMIFFPDKIKTEECFMGYFIPSMMQHPIVSKNQAYFSETKKMGDETVVSLPENIKAKTDTPVKICGFKDVVSLGGPEGTKNSYKNSFINVNSVKYFENKTEDNQIIKENE